MFKTKLMTAILTIGLILSTSGMAMAQNYYYEGPPPQYHQESYAAHKATKALEYGLLGADAGCILSGSHHLGTNILKGAAIGSAAGLLLGR